MPKFNPNIKFKLNSKTLKYVNMKELNNNKMKELKLPPIIPQKYLFKTCNEKI